MFMFGLLSVVLISMLIGFCNACLKEEHEGRAWCDARNFAFGMQVFTILTGFFAVFGSMGYMAETAGSLSLLDCLVLTVIIMEYFVLYLLLNKTEKCSAGTIIASLLTGHVGFLVFNVAIIYGAAMILG